MPWILQWMKYWTVLTQSCQSLLPMKCSVVNNSTLSRLSHCCLKTTYFRSYQDGCRTKYNRFYARCYHFPRLLAEYLKRMTLFHERWSSNGGENDHSNNLSVFTDSSRPSLWPVWCIAHALATQSVTDTLPRNTMLVDTPYTNGIEG